MGLMDLLKTSDPMEKFYAAAEKSNIPQGGVTGAAFKAMFPYGLGNQLFGREPEPMPDMASPQGTAMLAELVQNVVGPGTFIGPKGMARLFGDDAARGMLATAESKLAQGVPRESVFQELGVFKGPEGKWRYEIDDSGFALSDVNLTPPAARARNAGESEWFIQNQGLPDHDSWSVPGWLAMHHDELKRAYDDVNDIQFTRRSHGMDEGSYDARADNININMLATNPRSTALHELQHAVQGREGFAAGGSPQMFEQEAAKYRQDMTRLDARYALDAASEELGGWPANNQIAEWWKKELGQDLPEWALQDARQMTREELERAVNDYYSTFKALPNNVDTHAAYQRLAGEAEARAVQDRMNMSMDQRRASFPEYAGRNDLIVRGLMSGGE